MKDEAKQVEVKAPLKRKPVRRVAGDEARYQEHLKRIGGK